MFLKRFSSVPRLLLALALAPGLLGPSAAPAPAAAARLHPALRQLAANAPEQIVRVIVQKADRSGAAEALVARSGGTVLQDLRIINAFAAEMTAAGAQQIASSPAVRWVSLDAPVQESGGPDGTRDTK